MHVRAWIRNQWPLAVLVGGALVYWLLLYLRFLGGVVATEPSLSWLLPTLSGFLSFRLLTALGSIASILGLVEVWLRHAVRGEHETDVEGGAGQPDAWLVRVIAVVVFVPVAVTVLGGIDPGAAVGGVPAGSLLVGVSTVTAVAVLGWIAVGTGDPAAWLERFGGSATPVAGGLLLVLLLFVGLATGSVPAWLALPGVTAVALGLLSLLGPRRPGDEVPRGDAPEDDDQEIETSESDGRQSHSPPDDPSPAPTEPGVEARPTVVSADSDPIPTDSLWVRPDGVVRHPHEYCPNLIVDSVESWPRRSSTASGRNEPSESADERSDSRWRALGVLSLDIPSGSDFEYLAGLPRWVLAHTPFFVPLAAILYVLRNELRGDAEFLLVATSYVEALSAGDILSVGIGVGLLMLLFALVIDAELVDFWDLLRAIGVYGPLAVLAIGTVYGLAVGTRTRAFGLIWFAGYLLMVYVGGLLVYDGMLRTEFLFSNLGDRDHVDEIEYESALHDLRHDFDETRWHARTFAVVFTVLFEATRGLDEGTVARGATLVGEIAGGELLSLVELLLAGLTPLLNVFIVLVAFQFLVLIRHFQRIFVGRSGPGVGEVIRYEPFHPDGRGGFGDLGQFATRVNVLLVVGGLYIVYRFVVSAETASPSTPTVVQQAATTPGEAFPGVTLGIVVAYAVAALSWGYYSFWTMHREMAAGKRACLSGDYAPTTYGLDDDSWQLADIRDAPEWPISYTQLLGLLVVNLTPILFSLAG